MQIWIAGGNPKNGGSTSDMPTVAGYQWISTGEIQAAVNKLLSGECPDGLLFRYSKQYPELFAQVKAIRERKVWNLLPILILFSEPDADLIRRTFESGADGYLILPFGPDETRKSLDTAFLRRRILTRSG